MPDLYAVKASRRGRAHVTPCAWPWQHTRPSMYARKRTNAFIFTVLSVVSLLLFAHDAPTVRQSWHAAPLSLEALRPFVEPALFLVGAVVFFVFGRMEAAAAARLAKQGLATPVNVVSEAVKQVNEYGEAQEHLSTLGLIRWLRSLHRAPEQKPPRGPERR